MFLTSRLLWIDWLMVDMWLLGDLVDLERLRGLRDVRVVRAGVHLQLRDLLTTEAILGEHAPDGLLDGGAGVLVEHLAERGRGCLLYTSPSPRDGLLSRMPSSA